MHTTPYMPEEKIYVLRMIFILKLVIIQLDVMHIKEEIDQLVLDQILLLLEELIIDIINIIKIELIIVVEVILKEVMVNMLQWEKQDVMVIEKQLDSMQEKELMWIEIEETIIELFLPEEDIADIQEDQEEVVEVVEEFISYKEDMVVVEDIEEIEV